MACGAWLLLALLKVHTRDTLIDLLLAVVCHTVLKKSPALKLVLMSAAMDKGHLKSYFEQSGSCLGVDLIDLGCETTFRINHRYLDDVAQLPGVPPNVVYDSWEEAFSAASGRARWELLASFIIQLHMKYDVASSFLVFLPGRGELHQLRVCLEKETELKISILHATIAMEVQMSILKAAHHGDGGQRRLRRVVLATDVAESSLTIQDVDIVIDLCEHKRPRWNAVAKQSFLTTLKISKDEAAQRAGRTGRLREGTVIRMTAKASYAHFKQHADPCFKHARLEEVILTIFEHWRVVGKPEQFLNNLLDPPEAEQAETGPPNFKLHAYLSTTLKPSARPIASGNQEIVGAAGRGACRRWNETYGARPAPAEANVDSPTASALSDETGRFGGAWAESLGFPCLSRMPVDPEVGILVMNGAPRPSFTLGGPAVITTPGHSQVVAHPRFILVQCTTAA